MNKEYIPFKIFQLEVEVEVFTDRLKDHNIPFVVNAYASGLDDYYLGAGAKKEYEVMIPKNYREEVNHLLEKEAEADFQELDRDYFLFDFSDEELKEILAKPKEWFRKDVVYAGKILEARGVTYSLSKVRQQIREEKLKFLEPKKAAWSLLLLGYGLVPLSFLLGNVAGSVSFFIGLYLVFTTKMDDAGKRSWTFDKISRLHGKVITLLSLLVFLSFWLLVASDASFFGWSIP